MALIMTRNALVLFSILCSANILVLCSVLQDYDSIPSIRSSLQNWTDENSLPYPVLFRNVRQTVQCKRGKWTCKNGKCISNDQVCDGEQHCEDGSDETFVQCRLNKCLPHLFRCAYGACADGDAMCNVTPNCVDKSDEDNKICKPRTEKNNCSNKKYQCNSGECISRTRVCDGNIDCKDGSDETIYQCFDNPCLPHLFRCAYGACADGDAACDNKKDCADLSDEFPDLCKNVSTYDQSFYQKNSPTTITTTSAPLEGEGYCTVPPKPENGNYFIDKFSPVPGQLVPEYSSLRYACNKNHFPSIDQGVLFCSNGEWNPTSMECFKRCRNFTSTTVDYTCTYKGNNIPCMNMKHDTIVTSVCKGGHFENINQRLKKMKCIQGNWDNPEPNCIAECGEEVSTATPLIIGGQVASKGSSPWHIGIYEKKTTGLTYICGGTIVTNKVVISAAHCFDNGNIGKILPANNYALAAGKRKRVWDSDEDTVQKFEVLEIKTHERFGGFSTNLQNDIAILILDKIVEFNDFVHPVCLDLTNIKLKNSQIADGSYGQVAGWGLTIEGDTKSLSEVLMIAKLPVINYNTCKANMKSTFQKYLTTDKLCAGYLNGTTVCQGDSGGGLVFPSINDKTTRYYLRGIVSVGDFDDTGTTCKKDAYVAFTDIWHLKDLIADTLETINTIS